MTVAIIGAGLAGLACATRLAAFGYPVALFDKGRGPGGRMAARRVATAAGEAAFDHGAQYFTARDPAFMAEVERWRREGLAAPWPAAGPERWVGTPAMNAPLRRLAAALPVRWGVRAEALSGGPGRWTLTGEGWSEGPFEVVLLAVPAENAGPLLGAAAPPLAARARATPAEPCWTVMAAFGERLPVAADVLREDGPLRWAARNSAKPGRSGPEAWVLQAGPDWSRRHLEESPDAIVPRLLAALSARIGAALPEPLAASAHRWRYARSGSAGDGMLWDRGLALGLCGDWLIGPRVECAWLSGQALARAVAGDRSEA